MSELNHIDIGDIAKTVFLKGTISSLPVNQNDDLATVTLPEGPVSCGFLFNPFWDFGERANETPKGASGAFFEGDSVWVLKRDSDYRIISLQNPSPTKQRLSFNMSFKDDLGNQLDGPPSWSEAIDLFIYENPGFNLISQATWNGTDYGVDGEGNPKAEYDAVKSLWKFYLPNDYVPGANVTNFVISGRRSSSEVLYPDHEKPAGGYTASEYDAADAQIHPGRYEISFTASFSFLVDNPRESNCPVDLVDSAGVGPTWSGFDVLVEFWVTNNGTPTKSGVTDGGTIAGQLIYQVPGNPAPNGEEENVNFTVETFLGDAVDGESTSNLWSDSSEGAIYLKLTHNGPCSKMIDDGMGGSALANAEPNVLPLKIEGNSV